MSDKYQCHTYDPSPIAAIRNFGLKAAFVLIIPLVLTACATQSTGAVAVGNGTYLVSRQAGAFPSGREPLLVDAISEAQTKCSSTGKGMKLISQTENPGPYVMGNYPKATVIFSCE